jgi:hypothetical protein
MAFYSSTTQIASIVVNATINGICLGALSCDALTVTHDAAVRRLHERHSHACQRHCDYLNLGAYLSSEVLTPNSSTIFKMTFIQRTA